MKRKSSGGFISIFPTRRATFFDYSTYTDTAVTCGAVKWVKMWGVGNTGWTVLYGDTGWRDVKSLLLNGWKNNGGSVLLRRVGNTVTLKSSYLGLDGRAATKGIFITLPAGFSYFNNANYGTVGYFTDNKKPAAVSKDFNSLVLDLPSTQPMGGLSWITNDDYPSTLPGVAL